MLTIEFHKKNILFDKILFGYIYIKFVSFCKSNFLQFFFIDSFDYSIHACTCMSNEVHELNLKSQFYLMLLTPLYTV